MRRWSLGVVAAAALSACGGEAPAGGADGGVDGGDLDSKVDLVVRTVHGPASAGAGSEVAVSSLVANEGSEPAMGFGVVLTLTHESAPDTGQTLGLSLGGVLEPGASRTFQFTGTLPDSLAAGSYRLMVEALLEGDRNPADNRKAHTLPVAGAACEPDAFEEDDRAEDATPIEAGTPQAHDFCLDPIDWLALPVAAGAFYVARIESEGLAMPRILEGDGVTETSVDRSLTDPTRVVWTASADGTQYVAALQPLGYLGTGADTAYEITVGPVAPDLAFLGSPFLPGAVYRGGVLEVDDAVGNLGAAGAPATEVVVGLSAEPTRPADGPEVVLGRHPVPALEVDAEARWAGRYPVPTDLLPGTWHLFLGLDPDDAVAELDESNQWAGPFPLEVAAPPCAPDAWEEDDFPGEAAAVEPGVTQARTLCDDAYDWVRVPVQAGTTWRFGANQPKGDLLLRLFDGAGEVELAATEYGWTPGLEWTAEADGEVLLAVEGFLGRHGDGYDYTLLVEEKLPDPALTGLSIDPWEGEDVVAGQVLSVVFDVENAGHETAPALRAEFVASADAAADPGDRVLATRTLPALEPSAFLRETWDVSVPADLAGSDWHFGLRLDPEGTVRQGRTDNDARLLPRTVIAPECAPDAFEPDDTAAGATPLVLGTAVTANHCDDQLDWWQLEAEAGTAYQVAFTRVGRSGYFGSLHVSVWPPGADRPTIEDLLWDDEAMTFTPDAPGTWRLRVGRFPDPGGSGKDYRMTVTTAP